MISIAHITAPAAFGGLERVVSGLARETAARGHRVVLVLILDASAPIPAWAQALAELGVIVEPIRLPSRAYGAERAAVRAIIERYGIQVLHTHGYRTDVVHRATARACGVPQVSTVHGFTHSGWKGRFYEWLQLRALRGMDAVVAVSTPLEALLLRAGVSPKSIRRIVNGPVAPLKSPLSRAAARARLGLDTDGAVVGWVGRLSEEKGPDLLVRTAAQLPATATVAVVGDGPMRQECEALSRELGISARIRFAGAVDDASLLYSAFDLLLVSSRTEGTPMVVLEAAMGLVPIAAFAVGGLPDMLRDGRGWLVEPENVASLAAAASEAIAEPEASAARAAALMAHLREIRAAERWIDDYLLLYSELAARAGVAP